MSKWNRNLRAIDTLTCWISFPASVWKRKLIDFECSMVVVPDRQTWVFKKKTISRVYRDLAEKVRVSDNYVDENSLLMKEVGVEWSETYWSR